MGCKRRAGDGPERSCPEAGLANLPFFLKSSDGGERKVTRTRWTKFRTTECTPQHASWLNPIEKRFSVLVRHLLRRASFRSLTERFARIAEFIDYYNHHLAHPYRFRRRKQAAGKRAPCATVQRART